MLRHTDVDIHRCRYFVYKTVYLCKLLLYLQLYGVWWTNSNSIFLLAKFRGDEVEPELSLSINNTTK